MTTIPNTVLWAGDVDRERRDTAIGRAYDIGLEPCERCGRGVKDGAGWLVLVVDGGASLHSLDVVDPEEEEDPGYMGHYLLGSECAKRVPAKFKIRA